MIERTEDYSATIARLFPNIKLGEKELGVRTITFQVTDDCNLFCKYCYQINKQKHSMPFEVAQAFIEMLLEKDNEITKQYIDTWNSTGVIIEFIGGEPFLEIDLIDKISDYFEQRMIEEDHPWAYHHRFSICSNGLLYFDPKVQAYIQKHMDTLSFSISIDGNKQLHDSCRVLADGSGSYDIAMAGVRHYVDVLHGNMGSKMTLAPSNICYTYDAVIGLLNSGYTEINLNCVFEEGWTIEHAKILYDQLKQLSDYIIDNDLFDKIYISMYEENLFRPKDPDDNQCFCGGSGAMLSVDYKGDLYPCIRYMESSLGDVIEPIIVGNVWTGMLATDKQKQMFDCLHCTTRRSESTDECFYCPIADGCATCTAYDYQTSGLPVKRATYSCIMHKARALANAYFWNSYYLAAGENKRFKLWLPDEEALKIISQEELDYLHWLETYLPAKENSHEN